MSYDPFFYVDDQTARRLGPIDLLVDQHSASNYDALAGLDDVTQRAAAAHVARLLGDYVLPDMADLFAMDDGGIDSLARRVTYAYALTRLHDGTPWTGVDGPVGLPEFLAGHGHWYMARRLDDVLERVEGWEAQAIAGMVARVVLLPAGVDVRDAFRVAAVAS